MISLSKFLLSTSVASLNVSDLHGSIFRSFYVDTVYADYGTCCNTRTTRYIQLVGSYSVKCECNYDRKSRWQWIKFQKYLVVSTVLLGRTEIIYTLVLKEGTLKRQAYRETQILYFRNIFHYLHLKKNMYSKCMGYFYVFCNNLCFKNYECN